MARLLLFHVVWNIFFAEIELLLRFSAVHESFDAILSLFSLSCLDLWQDELRSTDSESRLLNASELEELAAELVR